MKNAKVKNRKLDRTAKQSPIAGIQIRSGVKAGHELGDHEFGSSRGGEFGRGPNRI